MVGISGSTDTPAGLRSFPHAAVPSETERTMKKLNKKQLMKKARGQGMTEYIIIVALIAIAAIGVITLFGDNIRKLFGASADALAGEESVTPKTKTFQASGTDQKKTLKSFGENNNANY
jgi:pilus assembly protein Flp/PilA